MFYILEMKQLIIWIILKFLLMIQTVKMIVTFSQQRFLFNLQGMQIMKKNSGIDSGDENQPTEDASIFKW